ncbi:anhydro-N-acetylmuramic acid kinase [Sphingobacterium spiritivorum ATCC 33300]|uniref:Anhydro-N-acetylmuramic acid kinase n=1 Tax=Sphingobacterium spiritivorum ATCC 33300 TaxID=525372 RepID=C2G1Q8_SPHSI|nr:anhydro-N-acetylmuramic acid kinase [Sphingobacterium spiritivorum]EEI90967.1 anhydro-N-acetylmuramic acid kinase [Sphingobacterium spiritivorum ATCC 33300]QQS97846.1 anhydro-N-acetylmuramic acid kinase [Sphingobacterium spiritivorum]
MNAQIAKLYDLAQKQERMIIGLMSGTSLDGLDIALCKISGSGNNTRLELVAFETMDYEPQFRTYVREVFSKRTIDLQTLSGVNAYVGIVHAKLINQALQQWQIDASQVDIIASHGQTVYHAPQSLTHDTHLPNSTLQVGDGDHIAVITGIITLSDFRQKHIAAGGEGAPLAAYGDFLLFTDKIENRILLNIGGISNFTFLPHTDSPYEAYATDLGPGNTMMNQYMKEHFDEEMDRDAHVARSGKPDQKLLAELSKEPFLLLDFPKTTGPELFNLQYLQHLQEFSGTSALSHEDVMATLCHFSADTIVAAILKQCKDLQNVAVYISGGGLHNPLLVELIKAGLPGYKITSFEELGLNPDAKEACLFALLANETLVGKPDHVNQIKDSPAVCMGKISLPA